jgi:hypothetical protein
MKKLMFSKLDEVAWLGVMVDFCEIWSNQIKLNSFVLLRTFYEKKSFASVYKKLFIEERKKFMIQRKSSKFKSGMINGLYLS